MPTYDELQAQIDILQKQANEAKGQEKSKAIADMKKGIAKYSITPAELGFSAKPVTGGKPPTKKAIGEPIYQDPETRKTWSGRGTNPKWFTNAIKAGKTKEDLLIDRPTDHGTPKAV